MSVLARALSGLAVTCALVVVLTATITNQGSGPQNTIAPEFPPRPNTAPGGRAIFTDLADLPHAEREARILAEIDAGNVPFHLRKTRTVELRAAAKPSKRGQIRIEVLTDFLAIGSDEDFVRVPLTPMSAHRAAIYGWHRAIGDPIQSLYVGHADTYVDYSHGVRLIRRTIEVDGKRTDMREVLSDPARHAIVSDEGPIARAQQAYGQ